MQVRSVTFEATILEMKDTYFLVEPVEGSQELRSADQITVPNEHMAASPEPEIGDVIEIKYNTSPNQWLSLIIPLTVCVQVLIRIVKCSVKGGIL